MSITPYFITTTGIIDSTSTTDMESTETSVSFDLISIANATSCICVSGSLIANDATLINASVFVTFDGSVIYNASTGTSSLVGTPVITINQMGETLPILTGSLVFSGNSGGIFQLILTSETEFLNTLYSIINYKYIINTG